MEIEKRLRHGSLFSGIGGFDLAAEWMGWENAFHCEWDDFGTKVLNYYWPNAKSYGDITKTDFMEWRGRIYILTGGFPCQPFSMAGKRKGKEDDRYLWPEMLRAIREIQPTWVIGENVGGIISMVQPCDEVEVGGQASLLEEDYFTQKDQEYVVETVCSDLEREGYSVQPFLIPACAIGAPHRRDRVWFVAKNTKCDGLLQREPEQERAKNGQFGNIGAGGGNGIYKQEDGGVTADTKINRNRRNAGAMGKKTAESERKNDGDEPNRCSETTPDTKRIRLEHNMERGCETEMFGEEGRGGQDCIPAKIQRIKATGERWSTPDTDSNRLERGMYENGKKCDITGFIASALRTQKGWSSWEKFPTQSPVCGRDDGLSDRLVGIAFPKWRTESIKAYGNAIVPQVAYEIFKAIGKCEDAAI